MTENLDDLPVRDIMRRWPATIRVFIAFRTHCVGCPIGDFHTIADTSLEHGLVLSDFRDAIEAAVAGGLGTGGKGARR